TAPGFDATRLELPESNGGGGGAAAVAVKAAAPAPAPVAAAAPDHSGAVGAADGGALELEPYIDTARCTSCDECININRKLFEYNSKKQAVIKDPKAGTFKELVLAAERCPVGIIHPGTPLNPKEKGLEKLIARAAPFN
ncbi:MAG: ferredoxin, partial [Gemmatimonadota bacterium]